MSRISAGYVRQLVIRALLPVVLTAGMVVLSVVRRRMGLSTSSSDIAAEASALAPMAKAMLAAACGFVFAFVLGPCVALLTAGRRNLWLLSCKEARRHGPEQVMPLRISGAHADSSFDFGAIYSDVPLDGPWLRRVFRNTALVVLPLPALPFVVDIGSAQAMANWIVGTGMLCLTLLGLWYEASKLPGPPPFNRARSPRGPGRLAP